MPPYSFGDCGAHSPALRAFSRTGLRRSSGMFSCSEKFAGSFSSGSTCSSMKARTFSRRLSISGGRLKSIALALDLDDLPAVDHDGRAGDVGAGVRHQQQQRAVEIALVAEAAHRDLALDGGTLL